MWYFTKVLKILISLQLDSNQENKTFGYYKVVWGMQDVALAVYICVSVTGDNRGHAKDEDH